MSAPVLELRALDVFDTVPAGHGALMVTDDAFEPHLHAGELAIFDTADREPQNGELFVIAIETPREPSGVVRRIAQAKRRHGDFTDGPGVAWWLRFELIQRTRLIDGPMRTDVFPRRACGRIVGVLQVDR